MPETYDAIIIGGGRNGLVTACYLARAKWKVLVLERRYIVGGACVTESNSFPSYKVSTAAYVNSLFRPEIIRVLRLADYGSNASQSVLEPTLVQTPPDLARTSLGDAFRPVAGYANYKPPLKNLYLCGSAAHPGGGVMGAPGWNAAREMLKN